MLSLTLMQFNYKSSAFLGDRLVFRVVIIIHCFSNPPDTGHYMNGVRYG